MDTAPRHFPRLSCYLRGQSFIAGLLATLFAAVCIVGSGCASSAGLRLAPTPPPPLALSSGWQLQDESKVSGSGGAAVSMPGYSPENWYKATVPGTVLTSLVNDGVYPEPLYGENNRPDRIPDSLCRTSYWYRKQFVVPKAFSGRNIYLDFAGINYIAEVWVNGHDLGAIRGAFARGRFNISPYVRAANAVAVLIQPPPHPGVPLEQTAALGTGHNGGILAEDGPTFLCSLGWDWIPGIRDRDMGLWQGVSLTSSGPVTIHDAYTSSDLPLPSVKTADLTVQATLRNETERPQFGILVGSYGPGTGATFRQVYTLRPGETRDVILTSERTPQLHVVRPQLWWPNGYGAQNLYTMRLKFVSAETGMVSDTSETRFGIRQIAYSYAKSGTDNLTLVVNDVPVVAKGGDWGMDEAMKRIPYKRLDAEIRMHKLANYTIIRNWVGQSTSDQFYNLCDKYGILVWDEFFQPNPADGPDPLDLPLYLANVREKILRYRSHPSIALWCGRNEGFPPPAINDTLTRMLAEIDPHRLYQPSSTDGRGVHSGGPYRWRAPQAYYDVDAPFKTEIGSVSIPTLEAVHAMMPPEDWNKIGDDDWAEHDLCRGAQQGDLYPAEIAARYGKTDTLAGFVREAQLADYESYRAMYEGRLCRLFAPTTGIITWMSNPAQPSTVWQLYSYDLEPDSAEFAVRHACEPVHVMLNETNGHVEVINNTAQAIDVNHSMTITARIYNLDGKQVGEHQFGLSGGKQVINGQFAFAPANAATDLGLLPLPRGLSSLYFVRLILRELVPGKPVTLSPAQEAKLLGTTADKAARTRSRISQDNSNIASYTVLIRLSPGKLISDNFYWRTTAPVAPVPKVSHPSTPAELAAAAGGDFSALNSLPDVTLDIHAKRRDVGGKCFLTVTVRNPGQSVALMAHLQLRRAKSNVRVLPVYYSDNYLSLVPGETKTVTIECAKSDLAGEAPALTVDGWNVTVMTAGSAGESVQVMPNDEAMAPQQNISRVAAR